MLQVGQVRQAGGESAGLKVSSGLALSLFQGSHHGARSIGELFAPSKALSSVLLWELFLFFLLRNSHRL